MKRLQFLFKSLFLITCLSCLFVNTSTAWINVELEEASKRCLDEKTTVRIWGEYWVGGYLPVELPAIQEEDAYQPQSG